jgi:hypothetical protein
MNSTVNLLPRGFAVDEQRRMWARKQEQDAADKVRFAAIERQKERARDLPAVREERYLQNCGVGS